MFGPPTLAPHQGCPPGRARSKWFACAALPLATQPHPEKARLHARSRPEAAATPAWHRNRWPLPAASPHIDHKVGPTAVICSDAKRGGVREPLLGHYMPFRHHALSTTFARQASNPVRGHVKASNAAGRQECLGHHKWPAPAREHNLHDDRLGWLSAKHPHAGSIEREAGEASRATARDAQRCHLCLHPPSSIASSSGGHCKPGRQISSLQPRHATLAVDAAKPCDTLQGLTARKAWCHCQSKHCVLLDDEDCCDLLHHAAQSLARATVPEPVAEGMRLEKNMAPQKAAGGMRAVAMGIYQAA